MIRRIDHLGIAVHSLEAHMCFWAGALGLEVAGFESVESEGVKVCILPVGDTRLELLEPLSPESPVGRFLAKRGEGVHHVCLEVDEIEASLDALRAKGVEPAGEAPRPGAHGRRVAFLHPRSTGGVLVELAERRTRPTSETSIGPGQPVLVYLRDPQEKLWGILRRLDASGLVVEGIDLSSFDDWVAQIERGEESVVGPSVLFVPAMRLEKILLDRSSGRLPSLAERFLRRTGRQVRDVLAEPPNPA